MTRKTWPLIALLTLTSLALAQTTAPAPREDSKIDPATWVPADALFYLGVTDVAKTWESFQQTSAYKLMQESEKSDAPAEVKAYGAFIAALREQIGKLLNVPPAQLKNPLTGALAFYVRVPSGGKLDEPEVTLVAQYRDADLMKKYYESAVTALKKNAKHESVKSGGQTIDTFVTEPKTEGKSEEGDEEEEELEGDEAEMLTNPEKAAARAVERMLSPDKLPPKLALCLTEDRFVVAADADAVRAALKREGKSLADTDDHKALKRLLKPLGTVQFLVNVPRLIELAKAEEDADEAEDIREVIQVLGLDSLRSGIGQISFAGGNYDSRFDLLLLTSGERSGILKLLAQDNRAIEPPATVSKDTGFYASLNLNIPRVLEEVERIIRQNDPSQADQFRAALEAVPLPGSEEPVNVRREVIEHLTGPLTFSLSFAKPIGPGAVRLLLTLGHRDQTALNRFLGKLQGMLTARDLRGTQVYDTTFPPGITTAVTSDRVVIGSTPGVESVIQGDRSEPLSDTPAWRRVAKLLPEQAWLTVFVDQRKLMEAALELGRNQNATPQQPGMDYGAMLLSTLTGGVGEDSDEEQLAAARKLVKYATTSVFTLAGTSEGVQLTQVTLKPDQE